MPFPGTGIPYISGFTPAQALLGSPYPQRAGSSLTGLSRIARTARLQDIRPSVSCSWLSHMLFPIHDAYLKIKRLGGIPLPTQQLSIQI